MDSTVKLVFQTIAAGSGLAEINRETGVMQKKLGKLGQGFTTLGAQIGGAFGKLTSSIGMLATGGIWGAAAMGGAAIVGKICEKWKEHNELMRKARLAARGLSEDYGTVEYWHRQYQKRVDSWRKKGEERRKAEEAAAKAEKERADHLAADRKRAVKFEQQFYDIEAKIAMEKQKAGLESSNELVRLRTKAKLMLDAAKAEVASKERALGEAKRYGNTYDVDLASKNLELAKAQQANAVAGAKRLVAEYKKAKEAAEDEAEARLDSLRREDEEREAKQRKREQGERKIAEVRKAAAEAVQKIEEKIAAAKKAGDEWSENAARARGRSFGDWARGERDRAREGRTDELRKSRREDSVDAEIAKIEAISPRARSKWHREHLAKLRQWRDYQNDANNPGNAVNDLEAKKQAVLDKSEQHLAAIEQFMRGLGL